MTSCWPEAGGLSQVPALRTPHKRSLNMGTLGQEGESNVRVDPSPFRKNFPLIRSGPPWGLTMFNSKSAFNTLAESLPLQVTGSSALRGQITDRGHRTSDMKELEHPSGQHPSPKRVRQAQWWPRLKTSRTRQRSPNSPEPSPRGHIRWAGTPWTQPGHGSLGFRLQQTEAGKVTCGEEGRWPATGWLLSGLAALEFLV